MFRTDAAQEAYVNDVPLINRPEVFLEVAMILFDGFEYIVVLFDLVIWFIQNQFVNYDECLLFPAMFMILEIVCVDVVDVDLLSLLGEYFAVFNFFIDGFQNIVVFVEGSVFGVYVEVETNNHSI